MKRGLITLFLIMSVFLIFPVNAEDYCVNAVVSDISPSSVGLNEEFTIGIQVENCGGLNPGIVKLEIITLPPDIKVSEAMIIEIPTLQYANSERFITYHMKTAADAKPGSHLLQLRLHYAFITQDYDIEITIIGKEAKLNIASVKTEPTLPYKGDLVELTLRIENFGDGTANSVIVTAEHPFDGIKQSFLGTLDGGEDGPAVFTFIADKKGDIEFPVNISYTDDFGENEISFMINLMILKKKTNWGVLIFSIFLIAGLFWFVRHYFKTKRKKDDVIKQLLEGKNNNGNKPLNNHKEFKIPKKNKSFGGENSSKKIIKTKKSKDKIIDEILKGKNSGEKNKKSLKKK